MQITRSIQTIVAPFALVAGSLGIGAGADAAIGPTSEYYVQSGNTMSVLQGTSVNRQFSTTASYAFAIDSIVRLKGAGVNGSDYTLAGAFIGSNGGATSGSSFFDGTTDGASNYAVNFDTSTVWRFDNDWSNGSQLFGSLPAQTLGITYDASDNTLWLSQYSYGSTANDLIEHRTMTGTLLSSFHSGVAAQAALALDPADGTLWVGQQFATTFRQFSKSGTLLQTSSFPAATGGNYLGGEFAIVPEPTTLGFLGLAAMGLRTRRRTNTGK